MDCRALEALLEKAFDKPHVVSITRFERWPQLDMRDGYHVAYVVHVDMEYCNGKWLEWQPYYKSEQFKADYALPEWVNNVVWVTKDTVDNAIAIIKYSR